MKKSVTEKSVKIKLNSIFSLSKLYCNHYTLHKYKIHEAEGNVNTSFSFLRSFVDDSLSITITSTVGMYGEAVYNNNLDIHTQKHSCLLLYYIDRKQKSQQ
jgi:hypothetical protein